MDSWVRSIFAGILLAGLAVLALMGFHAVSPVVSPLLETYTGLSDTSLIGVVLLVFLVGFLVGFRREEEEEEDEIFRRKTPFTLPNDRVKPVFDHTEVEEIEYVQEAYISYLQDRTRDLDDAKPIVLKIKLHPPAGADIPFFRRSTQLQRDILLHYLDKLKRFPNFKYVVFVDWFNRFLFFSKASAFRKEIEPLKGANLVDLMNAYRIQELSDYGSFNNTSLTSHSTNIKALKMMAKLETNEVMIVSHNWGRKYVGVVELNKLLSKMLAPKKIKDPRPQLRAEAMEDQVPALEAKVEPPIIRTPSDPGLIERKQAATKPDDHKAA